MRVVCRQLMLQVGCPDPLFGVFPYLFKLGHITPLIKKPTADANDRANYRPITNLNTVGKILERLAKKRLLKHLSRVAELGNIPVSLQTTTLDRDSNDSGRE